MPNTLFAAQAAGATTSDLYTLDPATAAPTSVGATGHAFTSLAFDPTDGTLYGTTSAGSSADPNSLFTLDPLTGTATLVGSMGGTVSDIAFDASGQMWGWTRRTSNGGLGGTNAALLQIDKSDASFAVIGTSGLNMQGGGISFHSDGTLYGLLATGAVAHLYTIDTATGAITDLGALTPSLGIVASASFDAADLLWLLLGGGGGTTSLKTVDVVALTDATIGNPGANFDALAWQLAAAPATPPIFVSDRIGDRMPWRYVITGRAGTQVTFLDRLATNRTLELNLVGPSLAKGDAPADNPEVNLPRAMPDGDPFLHPNSRLLYVLRRERGGPKPWKCRFGGIVMQIEDEAADDPVSHFTAYDVWQYLFSRPALRDDGTLPGKDGMSFPTESGDEIALAVLGNTIIFNGAVPIDTSTGTIESTGPPLGADPFVVQQGETVGDVWLNLVATGTMDIKLTPPLDIYASPGVVNVLNIYQQAGSIRNDAVFAWDKPGRSITGMSRLVDGLQLANKIQPFYGQGGPPGSLQTNAASVTKFGEYWLLQHFPGKTNAEVSLAALVELVLRRQGKRTVSFTPAPERSPVPLLEYDRGDIVPVWASRRLREPLTPVLVAGEPAGGYQRLYGISLDLRDDGVTTVSQLQTTLETV